MPTANIYLADHQRAFVLANEPRLALVAGIGSGKSYAGCVRALLAAGGQIGSRRIRTPNLGMITAPTFPMMRDGTLRTFFDIGASAIAHHNKSESLIRLTNGSEILFRSTEHADRLRGPSISWWMADEAALYRPLVWRVMIGRLRQFGINGAAWLTTTPRGRDWIWQRFVSDITPANASRYRLVRAATADNPFLDRAFVESLEDEYSGDFARQELMGEFVAFEGLIYPEFRRELHTTNEAVDLSRFKQVIAGVDWGYNNPGVILVGGIDGDDNVHIIHEEYQRRRPIDEWVTIAGQIRKTFGINTFYCDPSNPDYIEAFNEAGLPAERANNRVESGIQVVRQHLMRTTSGAPRLQITNSAPNLISEFEQYQWAANSDGLKDAPRKSNDHAMDALRYLLLASAEAQASEYVSTETRKYA